MDVVIRTDASAAIGGGHVMRCLALAGALHDAGSTVRFVSRDGEHSLCDQIGQSGFSVHRLPREHAFDSRDDALQTVAACPSRCDWLVVDHYRLDQPWETAVRARAQRILAIDDVASRPHDCDLLVDQNFSLAAGRYRDLVPISCELLLGPRYALLRREFLEARGRLRERDGRVRRVLVYFGNTDLSGGTLKALDAVEQVCTPDLHVDVVVGTANPYTDEIRRRCARIPCTELHVGRTDMAAAMSLADLAIGAGGATTWERCSLGLASIVIAISENQLPGSRDLGREGYVEFLGTCTEVTVAQLSTALRRLLGNPDAVLRLAQRSAELVDARGAERVAKQMLAAAITLRFARPDDCDAMHEWRNSPDIRARSNDPRPIPIDEHRRWYRTKLNDPDCVLLVGELAGKPIGVLRYDLRRDQAVVSIFLVPGWTGRGLGRKLLGLGSEWLRQHRPATKLIVAEILQDNEASERAFRAAGYARDADTYRKVL